MSFFLKIVLAILGPTNSRISWSIYARKPGDFHRDCIECVDQFGEYCNLNNIQSDFCKLNVFPFIYIFLNFNDVL